MHHININPMGCPRPRFRRFGGTYYPQAYVDYKAELEHMLSLRSIWIEGLIIFDLLEFGMPIPKSISKKKRELMLGDYHDKKPDIDNLEKGFLDACSGIIFADDNKVVAVNNKRKVYANEPYIKFIARGHKRVY